MNSPKEKATHFIQEVMHERMLYNSSALLNQEQITILPSGDSKPSWVLLKFHLSHATRARCLLPAASQIQQLRLCPLSVLHLRDQTPVGTLPSLPTLSLQWPCCFCTPTVLENLSSTHLWIIHFPHDIHVEKPLLSQFHLCLSSLCSSWRSHWFMKPSGCSALLQSWGMWSILSKKKHHWITHSFPLVHGLWRSGTLQWSYCQPPWRTWISPPLSQITDCKKSGGRGELELQQINASTLA